MGMTIEEVKEYEKSFERSLDDTGINFITLRDYVNAKYILKDQYEARLKADMVAMLTEIQLEIEESENCGKAFHLGLQMASNIIQQKINALRGE